MFIFLIIQFKALSPMTKISRSLMWQSVWSPSAITSTAWIPTVITGVYWRLESTASRPSRRATLRSEGKWPSRLTRRLWLLISRCHWKSPHTSTRPRVMTVAVNLTWIPRDTIRRARRLTFSSHFPTTRLWYLPWTRPRNGTLDIPGPMARPRTLRRPPVFPVWSFCFLSVST